MASSQTSGTCPSGHGMGTRSKSRKRERESQGQRKTAKGKKSTLYTTSVDDESTGAVGDEKLSSVAIVTDFWNLSVWARDEHKVKVAKA